MADLTATELQIISLKAQDMWQNTPLENNLTIDSVSARAILEKQTAKFSEFDRTAKDIKVKVTWVDTCGMETQECTDNCEIDATPVDTMKKEYSPNICQEISFSVSEAELRTNEYDINDFTVKLLAKSIGKLDEFWSKQILAKLSLFKGTNGFPSPYTFNVAKKWTEIDPTDFVLNKITANLIRQAEYNKIIDYFFIDSGSQLYTNYLDALLDAGNDNGKGNSQRAKILTDKFYFDPFNFHKAGVEDTLFTISTGALAFKTVNKWEDSPQVFGGTMQQTRYTVPSLTLPGVKYDVIYTIKCDNDYAYHTWKLITNGFIELAPESCETIGANGAFLSTGILSYHSQIV